MFSTLQAHSHRQRLKARILPKTNSVFPSGMSHPNQTRSSSGTGSGGSIILRQLSDRVMQSRQSSGRRIEHYSAQRAQDARDALPLIFAEKEKRASSRPASYFPPSPPPTYQPHQLIAVCMNHMAGRDCEHCRNLDRSLNDRSSSKRRSEASPDSNHTLGYQSRSNGYQRHSNFSVHDGRQKDGGENGGEHGASPVVGFWDSKLGKLRLQLLGLWGRTSKSIIGCALQDLALTLWQL